MVVIAASGAGVGRSPAARHRLYCRHGSQGPGVTARQPSGVIDGPYGLIAVVVHGGLVARCARLTEVKRQDPELQIVGSWLCRNLGAGDVGQSGQFVVWRCRCLPRRHPATLPRPSPRPSRSLHLSPSPLGGSSSSASSGSCGLLSFRLLVGRCFRVGFSAWARRPSSDFRCRPLLLQPLLGVPRSPLRQPSRIVFRETMTATVAATARRRLRPLQR